MICAWICALFWSLFDLKQEIFCVNVFNFIFRNRLEILTCVAYVFYSLRPGTNVLILQHSIEQSVIWMEKNILWVKKFQQDCQRAHQPVHVMVPKMNLDSHVNLMNVPKQKNHQNQNVHINSRLTAAVPPIFCVTKLKLINCHAAGTTDMNLSKAI